MKENKKEVIVDSIIGGICSAVVSVVLNLFFSYDKPIFILIIFLLLALLIGETLYIYKTGKKEKDNDQNSEILKENQDMKELLKKYEEVGITDCTRELKGTPLEPMKCMRSVKHTLYFMGVGGSKWVTGHAEYEQFEQMLKRVKASTKGDVRFLIIDPLGDGYKELAALRGIDAVPKESYKALFSLTKHYSCLQVHLYDHLPSFRLQFVDNEYVTASRYFFEREQFYDSSRGWGIPHLIVNADATLFNGEIKCKWSLYDSFRQLYDYIWENSKDISELKDTDILR